MSEKEERQFQPVANGAVTKGRRSVFKIILDEVVVKNFQEIKTNFLQDVILPSTLDWLYDVCASFVNDMFKSPGRGSTLPKNYNGKNTSYSSYYKGSTIKNRDRDRRKDEDEIFTWRDISFPDRKEAEKVISSMRGALMEYDIVTISDLCWFSNIKETWADRKYGWTDLDKASSYRARDGRYYLDLPEPMPIEND